MERPGSWTVGARSTAEGTVEERGKEVLGLSQGLALYRAEALLSLNQGCELLLKYERGHDDLNVPQTFDTDVVLTCGSSDRWLHRPATVGHAQVCGEKNRRNQFLVQPSADEVRRKIEVSFK